MRVMQSVQSWMWVGHYQLRKLITGGGGGTTSVEVDPMISLVKELARKGAREDQEQSCR